MKRILKRVSVFFLFNNKAKCCIWHFAINNCGDFNIVKTFDHDEKYVVKLLFLRYIY